MSREFLPVPLPTELDALFGQYVAAQQAPGLVYGLFGPGGLVHSAGFGTAAALLADVAGGFNYSNPPGATFEYSNLGYALVGVAIARASSVPLAEWIVENICAPVGLASTRFDTAPLPTGTQRATGFTLDATGAWTGPAPATSDAYAAAAGMRSTVRDLATWATYLGAPFRQPSPDGPLSAAARSAMQRVHYLFPPGEARPGAVSGPISATATGYGLGLIVREDPAWGRIVAHSGGLPGFILYLVWHLDSGHGIVVLTNSHRGNPVLLAEDALTRALRSHRAPARTIRLWPQTVELLTAAESLIRSWDDALADEILAPNIAFDRPLADRRADIDKQIAAIGPLDPPRDDAARPDLVVAASRAHVTWAIGGQRGELLCHIHVTPLRRASRQGCLAELIVAIPHDDMSDMSRHVQRFYIAGISCMDTNIQAIASDMTVSVRRTPVVRWLEGAWSAGDVRGATATADTATGATATDDLDGARATRRSPPGPGSRSPRNDVIPGCFSGTNSHATAATTRYATAA